MSGIARRTLLQAAILGACLPGRPALALTPLRIPDRQMRLERTITRGLGANASITVARAWHIDFANQGSGFVVTGNQVDVAVSAPPTLSGLAKMEEARSTDAMFPMMLSGSGLLMSTGKYTAQEDVAKVLAEARRVIRSRAIPEDQKAAQLAGLAELQKSAGTLLSRLPPDLFFPVEHSTKVVEPVSIAEGMNGEFELEFEAKCASDAPWLKRLSRRATTRIGESERRSSDVWTMAPV